MRSTGLLLVVAAAATRPLASQQLTTADSNLVYAILTAEDRRDSMAPALAEGIRNADARVRLIAERARGRITDSLFAARRTLPTPLTRITWPLPAWRVRHDSLRFKRDDCGLMYEALEDSILQVRLRALDLVRATCERTDSLRALIAIRAVLALPPNARSAEFPWHEGAHALLAWARLWPEGVRNTRLVTQYASSPNWHQRAYAAQAARILRDTSTLRELTRDRSGNVVEAAVDGLAAVAGHAEDSTYIRLLDARAPQAVRAAAVALKGSTDPRRTEAAERALRYWKGRRHDSERDARLALLDLLGRPVTEDAPWRPAAPLPRSVVTLALGRMDTLVVALASGDSFLVRLRGDIAPITAARVLALVDRGDYRNTTWHRVISDFVIQGALPGNNEYVGGSHYFRDELGNLSHLRGGVGMSTRGHDTGDGQWFIDLSDLPRLDRDYTLFGEVIAGMDVVDGVLEGTPIISIRRTR